MAKEKKKPKAKEVPEERMIKPTEMDLVEKLSISLKRMHRHS